MTNKTNIPELTDMDFIHTWTLDKELKVIFCNEMAEKLSHDLFKGLLEKDKKLLEEFIRGEAIKPEQDNGIYLPWVSPENSDSLWFKWKVKRKEDVYFVFALNVSDVKNNELYLAQILDSIPDLILVKGKDSHIVWANKAFQDHYHLNNQELKELIDAPFVEPDYTKQYIIDDKEVWDTGKPLIIECEPVMRHDGVVRKFQTLKTPIFGPNNKILYTVGVSRDITEKIENEEKSITASKMAAIGEMAGGMAHEINNPMAVIAGKVFILRRMLNKEAEIDKNLILNYLDTIQQHVERISKVINCLRKLSVDDDYENFNLVNISHLIGDTLLLCETKIKEKGIELIVQVPEELMCEVRPIQFSQAILNIINNATEAVEKSRVRWIKIIARKFEDMLELLIIDSGTGVPDEIIGKIMQPFFTTKDVGKGTGLGLSFALSVARNHHGTLKVEKEIAPSCFMMRIPLIQKNHHPIK